MLALLSMDVCVQYLGDYTAKFVYRTFPNQLSLLTSETRATHITNCQYWCVSKYLHSVVAQVVARGSLVPY